MTQKVEKFPGVFPGTIKSPLDVLSLIETADVVCQGTVINILDEGDVEYLLGKLIKSFKRKIAIFKVDGVYKGTVFNVEIEIEFLHPDFPSSMESLEKGEYLLVFLVMKDAHYQLANLTTSKVPISREILNNWDEVPPPESIRQALIYSLDGNDLNVALAAIEQLRLLKR